MPYYPQDPWEERTQDAELRQTRTTQPQQYGIGQRLAPFIRAGLFKWLAGLGTGAGGVGVGSVGPYSASAGYASPWEAEAGGGGVAAGFGSPWEAEAGAGGGAAGGGSMSGLGSFLSFLSPLLVGFPAFKGGEGEGKSSFIKLIGDWLDTKGGPFG